jgi:hypothetical protein
LKDNVRVKRSNIVALGGMIAAVSVVLMLLTVYIPLLEQALPALAGVLLIAAVIETGTGWAFVIYTAVGLLSLLFAFQNGAAFYYILFFGQYTIVKSFIERIPQKPLQWVVKIILFNVCAVAVYFVVLLVAGLPQNVFVYGYPVTIALINVMFIVYDIALSRLVVTYRTRIRKLFRRL